MVFYQLGKKDILRLWVLFCVEKGKIDWLPVVFFRFFYFSRWYNYDQLKNSTLSAYFWWRHWSNSMSCLRALIILTLWSIRILFLFHTGDTLFLISIILFKQSASYLWVASFNSILLPSLLTSIVSSSVLPTY